MMWGGFFKSCAHKIRICSVFTASKDGNYCVCTTSFKLNAPTQKETLSPEKNPTRKHFRLSLVQTSLHQDIWFLWSQMSFQQVILNSQMSENQTSIAIWKAGYRSKTLWYALQNDWLRERCTICLSMGWNVQNHQYIHLKLTGYGGEYCCFSC